MFNSGLNERKIGYFLPGLIEWKICKDWGVTQRESYKL